MSEWYDSQKKPIVDFRKLRQERLDKVNPCRKLAKDETTKLAKIEGFMVELLSYFWVHLFIQFIDNKTFY